MEATLTFIEQQSAEQRLVLLQLRELILDAAPHIQEDLKWKIPFYSYQGLLCYLNPQPGCVALGFCRGALLSNQQGLLQGDGKEVRLLKINCKTPILKEEIRELLQEAMLLNETMQRRKNYYV